MGDSFLLYRRTHGCRLLWLAPFACQVSCESVGLTSHEVHYSCFSRAIGCVPVQWHWAEGRRGQTKFAKLYITNLR